MKTEKKPIGWEKMTNGAKINLLCERQVDLRNRMNETEREVRDLKRDKTIWDKVKRWFSCKKKPVEVK